MPAHFQAKATFVIPSRRLFVISGEVLGGVVKKGMIMNVPLNSSSALSLPIHGVEFVTRKEGSEVALTVLCGDGNELSKLQSIRVVGEEIEIGDAEGPVTGGR